MLFIPEKEKKFLNDGSENWALEIHEKLTEDVLLKITISNDTPRSIYHDFLKPDSQTHHSGARLSGGDY
jgi:hypothetical protein